MGRDDTLRHVHGLSTAPENLFVSGSSTNVCCDTFGDFSLDERGAFLMESTPDEALTPYLE